MWQWLRELREILNEPPVCPSCEILKTEITNMRHERDILLNKVLSPSSEPIPQATQPLTIPTQKHRPWRVMQQELERKDAVEAARIKKEFEERTANLERNLGVANGEKAL